jgi:FkbM family methyltransferase
MKPYRVPKYVALLNPLFSGFYPAYRMIYFLYKRISDRALCSFLKKMLRDPERGRNPVILDIGANIGFYSRLFAENTGGDAVIYAFEPERRNVEKLIEEISSFKNICVYPYAVSDTSGSIEFTISPDSSVDHHISAGKEDSGSRGGGVERTYVRAVTIDEICADLPSVDIIKMDIQGAEYFALKGMLKTLKRSPDVIILMEFWPWGFMRAGSDWKQLTELLKENHLTAESFDGTDIIDFCRANAHNPNRYLDVVIRGEASSTAGIPLGRRKI